MTSLIFPDWPQPDNIGACSTLREGELVYLLTIALI